jgi:hypothetical protein
MARRILFFLLAIVACNTCRADERYPGLQVGVTRKGDVYSFTASFDTILSKCAAYHYLTDYQAAKELPGVIKSSFQRESADHVKVDRIASERILFFRVRIHSVMEYTEKPFDGLSFMQLSGDSKMFRGTWEIVPKPQGSTLQFSGTWEPDTLIPNFIIDHFAENGLIDKFSAVARLAEKLKDKLSATCVRQQMAVADTANIDRR